MVKELALLLALGVAGCTVSFDEGLLVDGSTSRLDTAALDVSGDAGVVDSAAGHDQPTVLDTKGPDLPATVLDTTRADLPAVDCTDWANWTCSMKVQNSVSRCPTAGVQVYSLVCNATGCSCTNKITLAGQSCSTPPGITCADAQAAFAAGCCSGV